MISLYCSRSVSAFRRHTLAYANVGFDSGLVLLFALWNVIGNVRAILSEFVDYNTNDYLHTPRRCWANDVFSYWSWNGFH